MSALAIPAPAGAATARPRRFALLRHSLVLARRGHLGRVAGGALCAGYAAYAVVVLR